jgi:3-methyladenine DNA glycosylase/8-oxoguanine DNA glycosylase
VTDVHTAAETHLRKADPTLARIIDAVGPCMLEPATESSYFQFLLRSIVFQQLAGAAARTIHDRIIAIYDGKPPEPEHVIATPDKKLRAAGLSSQKVSYVRDLARRAASGELPLHTLDALSDDEVMAVLVQVKGIGPWTAQMFLMFRLGRPDILPDLDYGVKKAMQLAYRMRKLPNARRMHEIGNAWSPHRTVATWYMWRSLDLPGARPKKGKKKRKAKGKSKGGSRRSALGARQRRK